MEFKSKDLSIALATAEETNAGKKNWVFMVACGDASVECDNTQRPPRPYKRLEPVDVEDGLRSDGDLLALRYELRRRLDALERELAARGVPGAGA